MCAFPPQKLPELQKSDLLHLHPAVGLNTPQKIGTAPGRKAMASGGIPHEAKRIAHAQIITTKDTKLHEGKLGSCYRGLVRVGTAEGGCPHIGRTCKLASNSSGEKAHKADYPSDYTQGQLLRQGAGWVNIFVLIQYVNKMP